MVLGTSEVEIAYNTYRDDPTEAHLKAFIRSKPRDHEDKIAKEVYLEAIRDSRLSWDKRLKKRLFEKPNRILIQLCQDSLINHLSRNNKAQLVNKLVTHFQEKSGEWDLTSTNKQYHIVNTKVSSSLDSDKSLPENDQEIENQIGSLPKHDRSLKDESKSLPNDDRNHKDKNRSSLKHDPDDPKNNRSTANDDHTLNVRKNVAIPKYLLKYWNPEKIRSHLESDHRSLSSNDQNITKTIWLTKVQAKNWDTNEVRAFLRSLANNDHPGMVNNDNMKNRILQNKIDALEKDRESFIIVAKMFNSFMKDPKTKQEIFTYFHKDKDSEENLQKVLNSIKRLKKTKRGKE
jgi:hypothetical protein